MEKSSITSDEQQGILDAQQEILDKKEAERRQKAYEAAKQKRKLIPPGVMLTGGAIASITMVIRRFELKDIIVVLVIVLVLFYIAGGLIRYMFDRFAEEIKEREDEKVIEKSGEENGSPEGSDSDYIDAEEETDEEE
jgi:divalent metal cation (Fe/Co/Zn/Cd) transporter